jgi:hypothetical protein
VVVVVVVVVAAAVATGSTVVAGGAIVVVVVVVVLVGAATVIGTAPAGATWSTVSSTHSFHGWNNASTTARATARTPPIPRITQRRDILADHTDGVTPRQRVPARVS